MTGLVTVAIPVRNAGAEFEQTLAAVRDQRFDGEIELLVCDSGSSDGSPAIARRHGARVITIAPAAFSHGGTRNLLMAQASGSHVALLTQDAVPASDHWLARLCSGFELASDVGLVFGPYRPRDDASPMVSRELTHWFAGFASDGQPRVDRLTPAELTVAARELLGARGYFTDANACIAKAAWTTAPFRAVPYAEDHVLAHDMMRAGYAKVFLPDAAVIHSHEYSTWNRLRRSFDEARALEDIYGYREPLHPRQSALKVWGLVGADRRWALERGQRAGPALLTHSLRFHLARTAGAVLGSRAGRLPAGAVRRLSLEGRG